jgi:hypothetical protein
MYLLLVKKGRFCYSSAENSGPVSKDDPCFQQAMPLSDAVSEDEFAVK